LIKLEFLIKEGKKEKGGKKNFYPELGYRKLLTSLPKSIDKNI
jgi:hypothetical protein